jgi:hypothetical protein
MAEIRAAWDALPFKPDDEAGAQYRPPRWPWTFTGPPTMGGRTKSPRNAVERQTRPVGGRQALDPTGNGTALTA